MANYTYKCYNCLKTKDVSHGIFEKVEISCDCGKVMNRIITSSAYYKNPPEVNLDDL